MHILFAMPGWKPAYRIGGPIMSVSATAEMLVKKGHRVTVVATNANLDQDIDVPVDRPVDVDGVTVWYFRREEPLQRYFSFVPYLAKSMGFMYAPAMKAALDAIVAGVDVVDTQMPFVYPTYAVARAALRHHKPLFYHQRGNFLASHLGRRSGKKSIYISLFEKPVLRRATTLIALTDAEKSAFARVSPGTPSEVVPNGIHLPAENRAAAQRVATRYGIPADALLVLFLGRLHPWKGADEILAAFARVQREHPDAYLVMAGADECDAAARWSSVAQREGWSRRVVFPGVVTGDDKLDLLDRADLFSLPSSGEGLSMATLEALAHRTAVMLSPQCNFPDAERAGAGVTVEKNVDAMSEAMSRLLGDRARLKTMGEAGRSLVEREYSWDVVTDRLIDVYERGHRELIRN
jgi:glycosyltransferase involved in cell wall biosynthesis